MHIVPEIRLNTGYALPVPDSYTRSMQATSASFSRSFTALFGAPPGSTGSFVVEIGGRVSALGAAFTTARGVPENITAIARTSAAYVDSNVFCVGYQLRDGHGLSQVLLTGLSVSMFVSHSGSGSNTSSYCQSPSASTGIGTCYVTLPTSWFTSAAGQAVGVVTAASPAMGGSGVIVSNIVSVTLFPANSYPSVSGITMTATLPQYAAKLPGDSLSMPVTASTGTNSLTSWVLTLYFDPMVISFQSAAASSLYTSAVVVPYADHVVVSSSGLSSTASASDVMGSAVPVCTLHVSVVSSAAAGVHTNATLLYVNAMVNEYTLMIASAFYASVHGEISSVRTVSGQVTVVARTVSGIFAYSPQAELVNTAVVTGSSVSSEVIVMALYNDCAMAPTDITSSSTCALYDDALSASGNGNGTVLSVTAATCEVSVRSDNTMGSAAVTVRATYDDFTADVPFRIWVITNIDLTLADNTLNLIG